MSLVLDSGGVDRLAGDRSRLAELRRRGQWPPTIPAVVLTECLTGDHRRDFHTNHLLRMSGICAVTEQLARSAAGMRSATGRAGTIAATDAIVAALAVVSDDPVVLTSDPSDIRALVDTVSQSVTVARV